MGLWLSLETTYLLNKSLDFPISFCYSSLMKTRKIGSIATFDGRTVTILSRRTRGVMLPDTDNKITEPFEFHFYLVALPPDLRCEVKGMNFCSGCAAINENCLKDVDKP